MTDTGITVVDRSGSETDIAADSVVLAAGFRPNRELIEGLRSDPTLQVLEAGDCVTAAQDLRRHPRGASGGQVGRFALTGSTW